MIDNYKKAMELVGKMRASLPIPVVATKRLLASMRENEFEFPEGCRDFEIEEVVYMGDEGGICCKISLPDETEKNLFTSLTHLRVRPGNPLSKEIKSYQTTRTKKLARQHRKGPMR